MKSRLNADLQDVVRVAPKAFAYFDTHRALLTHNEQIKKMQDWATQYKTEDVVVYCNGCEKGLRLGGVSPIHMLDVIAKGL